MVADNSVKLLTEYRKFFADGAASGIGEYKTYVIKNDGRNDVQANLNLSSLITVFLMNL